MSRHLTEDQIEALPEEQFEAYLVECDREAAARLAANIARGWREETCGSCSGFGVVSDYGAMGTDFYGAKDCDGCGGQGRIWRSPSGKHAALWPGGPFCE